MSTTVQYNLNKGVATLHLNRPKTYNAFNREMALALLGALQRAAKDEAVRVVVLTGTGKAFCAGQDLREVTDDNGIEFEQILTEHYNPIIMAIRELSKPVLCAVNGIAAGAGANIAFACDITVAKASAKFTQAFSKIGLVPDSGGTFFLPRLVGMQRAAALMMLSDTLTAEEAANMGLIYQAIPDEDYESSVEALAQRMAKMPTRALGMTKGLLNQSWNNSLAEQLELEGQYQIAASNRYDYKEGVQAFLEKRKPKFLGK